MDTARERNAHPAVGPRFFRAEDGELMFEFVIDHGNIIGPRLATKADSEKHPLAWSQFLEPAEIPEPPELPARSAVVVEAAMEASFQALEAARSAPEPEPTPKRAYTRRKAA